MSSELFDVTKRAQCPIPPDGLRPVAASPQPKIPASEVLLKLCTEFMTDGGSHKTLCRPGSRGNGVMVNGCNAQRIGLLGQCFFTHVMHTTGFGDIMKQFDRYLVCYAA